MAHTFWRAHVDDTVALATRARRDAAGRHATRTRHGQHHREERAVARRSCRVGGVDQLRAHEDSRDVRPAEVYIVSIRRKFLFLTFGTVDVSDRSAARRIDGSCGPPMSRYRTSDGAGSSATRMGASALR